MAIVQTGTTLTFSPGPAISGTVSSTITVPADAEFVVVGFSAFCVTANFMSGGSMTFTKGGVDTAMVPVSGGDALGGSAWSAGLFYLALPDTGANQTLKWVWTAAATNNFTLCSVTFWKGIDTASPVRGTGAGQSSSSTPYTTGTITAASGDLIIAFVGGFANGEGSIDSWSNLTLLANLTHTSDADGAWATGSPTGNTTVEASTDTLFDDGSIVAISVKPAAGGGGLPLEGARGKRLFLPRSGPARGLRSSPAFPPVSAQTQALSALTMFKSAGQAAPSVTASLSARSSATTSARAAGTFKMSMVASGKLQTTMKATLNGVAALSANTSVEFALRSTMTGTVSLAARSLVAFQTADMLTLVAPLGPQEGRRSSFLFKPGRGPTWVPRQRAAFPPPPGLVVTALFASTTIRVTSTATMQAKASLSALAGVEVSGKASPSGKASMAAATMTAVRGVLSNPTGTVALAARTLLATSATLVPPGITALFARTMVRVTGGAVMSGRTSLAARSSFAIYGRVVPPGVVALFARTLAAVRGAAQVSGQASLSGRSAMQTKASAPIKLSLFMAAAARVSSAGKAVVTGAAGLSARTKTAIRATAAISGGVPTQLALSALAGVRTTARAVIAILKPVIPTPVYSRPGRLARLRGSLERAFGETFDIEPMTTAGADVNNRMVPDISRDPVTDVTGIWQGPTTSRTPTARGAVQDDNAHNWNASFPSARFDAAAVASVRKGDKLTRQLDGSVWRVERVVPDGFGRTTLQLTSRKRTTN